MESLTSAVSYDLGIGGFGEFGENGEFIFTPRLYVLDVLLRVTRRDIAAIFGQSELQNDGAIYMAKMRSDMLPLENTLRV